MWTSLLPAECVLRSCEREKTQCTHLAWTCFPLRHHNRSTSFAFVFVFVLFSKSFLVCIYAICPASFLFLKTYKLLCMEQEINKFVICHNAVYCQGTHSSPWALVLSPALFKKQKGVIKRGLSVSSMTGKKLVSQKVLNIGFWN